ncbi:MAG: hypothetical protein K6A96_11905 [Prevotella sp.]|nr:hypothetical protein [Prevotella sp.]
MARKRQPVETVMQPRLNITLRTAPNGYLLDVDDEGYMYFDEQSLLEGFCIHVGLQRRGEMTRQEINDLLKATQNGTAERQLQREVNELRAQVRELKKEVRRLKLMG